MKKFQILKYYSNPFVQEQILKAAKDREVVGSVEDGSFLKRPDVLIYPKDIEEKVKRGAVAFHCSVERWVQPMQLSTGLRQEEMDNLRKGFDFIIDIDAKVKVEHSAVAAKVVCDFLSDMGIKPTVKFSGSRGFHIGIAGVAFPEKINFKETRTLYPEAPQALAGYISENVKDRILDELVKLEGGAAALLGTVPSSVSELTSKNYVRMDDGTDNTFLAKPETSYVFNNHADIEKGWSNRHLFRMPYSLHPKFWLVSLPIKPERLLKFDKEMARPENVKNGVEFLVNEEGEAADLLMKALDWKLKQPKEDVTKGARMIRKKSDVVVPEEMFPPCIKLILKGLSDGKKRSLFTLLAFMRTVNWKPEEIEKRINEWNSHNAPPLSERTIKTQLKWHFRQVRELMPANCSSDMFYSSIGVCQPDANCSKNPVNYPFRLMKGKRTESPKKENSNS
jgi:hypothetical protein